MSGLPVIAKDVAERVPAGELDTRQAERMMGSLLLLSAGAPYSRSTYYKRRAELRDHGYVVADDFFTPVEVDLAAVLEAALETPLWGVERLADTSGHMAVAWSSVRESHPSECRRRTWIAGIA